MGIKDLVILKEREYRLFLVLVICLLVGFSFMQFKTTQIVGFVIFFPLLAISVILFFISFILKKNLKEMSFKSIIKYCILAIPLFLVFTVIILYAFIFLFLLSIISYIFITSLFTLHNCYKWGVRVDEKLYKLPSLINFLTRVISFIGGFAFSIILMMSIFWVISLNFFPEGVFSNLGVIPMLMILIFVFLFLVCLLFLLLGKFNTWIGVFLLYASFYACYLIFKAFLTAFQGEGSILALPIQIVLFLFDLFLLLVTIGSLIGKKAEILSNKLKFIKPDVILIWLIFSKAANEFASGFPDNEMSNVNIIISFIVFIPILLFMSLYGMVNYFKLKKLRKKRKKAKKLKKKSTKKEKRAEEEKIKLGKSEEKALS